MPVFLFFAPPHLPHSTLPFFPVKMSAIVFTHVFLRCPHFTFSLSSRPAIPSLRICYCPSSSIVQTTWVPIRVFSSVLVVLSILVSSLRFMRCLFLWSFQFLYHHFVLTLSLVIHLFFVGSSLSFTSDVSCCHPTVTTRCEDWTENYFIHIYFGLFCNCSHPLKISLQRVGYFHCCAKSFIYFCFLFFVVLNLYSQIFKALHLF